MAESEQKPPYFPFYPIEFAADSKVEAMSTLGVGAYILLLCKAWHEDPPGTLPTNDCLLARWARLTTDDWAMVKGEVLAAFSLNGERLYQKRMRKEYEKFRNRSKSASDAAHRRWIDANAMRPHSDRISEGISNPHPRGFESGSDSSDSGKENGFEKFWRAYPRKVGKLAALRKWGELGLEPHSDRVLAAVDGHKKTEQWQRECGRYIPHPTTWLNQGRWMDEVRGNGQPDPQREIRLAYAAYQQASKNLGVDSRNARSHWGDYVKLCVKHGVEPEPKSITG